MKKIIFLFAIITFFFSSCIKEELPVLKHDSGDVLEKEIAMRKDYSMQLFYSLENNEVVKSNLKSIWDLGFESSEDGWHIILNTSKAEKIHRTSATSFQDFTGLDFENIEWNWDNQSGNLDSTAVGDYRTNSQVYILDRGYDEEGIEMGSLQFKVKQLDQDNYELQWTTLAVMSIQKKTIAKSNDLNNVCFSFDTENVVDIEPNKENWDLLFTQYTHLFTDPVQAYTVTGVLQNSNNSFIAFDTTMAFQEITFDDIPSFSFNENTDAIGYDWKYYNFDEGQYSVFDKFNYIVKTNKGIYYKLHFIDFYNQNGEKGYPKFEVQEL